MISPRGITAIVQMPANQRLSASQCPLCGNSSANRILFELTRPVIKCDACDLVYATPGDKTIQSRDFNESYYRRGVYADYLSDAGAIRKNAQRTLGELENLVEGRALLDVGCATGFFLEAARSRGWTVRGLEVSSYAAEYARRELHLDVVSGSIESFADDSSKFDVVTLWDTIEHLGQPDLALSNIRRLLHPQGVLVLSTGDYGSILRRITGKRWRLFADPTHNFFFEESTLKRLLEQTGYELVHLTRRGKWVTLSMILHQSPVPFRKVAETWLGALNSNPAIYVNLFDVMTVFARPSRD
jgi:2-polyprenyl-3-methyl-5-hydroxy-6-metoxy-1,4-benzoquinol methylase